MWNLVFCERYEYTDHDLFLPLEVKEFNESGRIKAMEVARKIWLRRVSVISGSEGHRFARISNPRLCWIDPDSVEAGGTEITPSLFDAINVHDPDRTAEYEQ